MQGGVLLSALALSVFPGCLDHRAIDPTPATYESAVANCALALSAASYAGAIFSKAATPEAVAAGKPRAVMDACFGLLRAASHRPFDIAAAEGRGSLPIPGLANLSVDGEGLDGLLALPPTALLLRWANFQLARSSGCASAGRLDSFGEAWADGVALCALMRAVQPTSAASLPVTDAAAAALGPEAAVTAALSAAFGGGVPPWFSVESFVEGNGRLQSLFVAYTLAASPRLDSPLPPGALPVVPASLAAGGPWAFAPCPSRPRAWAKGGATLRFVAPPAAAALERELTAALSSSTSAAPTGSLAGVPAPEVAALALDARFIAAWANGLHLEGLRLRARCGLGLLRELRDGTALLRLVDSIEDGIVPWGSVTLCPTTPAARAANADIIVKLGAAMELGRDASGAAIPAEALTACLARPSLAFAWQLMRYATLQECAQITACSDEGELLAWANGRVAAAASAAGQPGELVKIRSWGDSELRTGMYLLYLLEGLMRGCVNWGEVADGDTRAQQLANAGYVLSLARRAGAAAACSPEDIVDVRPRAIAMLVAALLLSQRPKGQ
jgi:hypothetical protein